MKIKELLLISLIGLFQENCSTPQIIKTVERPIINSSKETKEIIKFKGESLEKKVSREEAKDTACNEAKNNVAKNISNKIIETYQENIEYTNGETKQEIKRELISMTNTELINTKIEKITCEEKEEKYSCVCIVSMIKEEYENLIQQQKKRKNLEFSSVRIEFENKVEYIDKTEVTEGEFTVYLRLKGIKEYKIKCKNGKETITYKLNPFNEKDIQSKKPMMCIDQKTALDYCKTFQKDLPTKEEWEVAAGTREFPFGNEEPTFENSKVNFGYKNTKERETEDVGTNSEDISTYNLQDMGGNVAEWTKEKTKDNKYFVKGGAWNLTLKYMRTKNSSKAINPSTSIGFRCISRE